MRAFLAGHTRCRRILNTASFFAWLSVPWLPSILFSAPGQYPLPSPCLSLPLPLSCTPLVPGLAHFIPLFTAFLLALVLLQTCIDSLHDSACLAAPLVQPIPVSPQPPISSPLARHIPSSRLVPLAPPALWPAGRLVLCTPPGLLPPLQELGLPTSAAFEGCPPPPCPVPLFHLIPCTPPSLSPLLLAQQVACAASAGSSPCLAPDHAQGQIAPEGGARPPPRPIVSYPGDGGEGGGCGGVAPPGSFQVSISTLCKVYHLSIYLSIYLSIIFAGGGKRMNIYVYR